MTASLNLIVGTIADDVAGASEKLDQDRDRIGFGVRPDCPDHIAGQTVIGILAHLGLLQLRQWARSDGIRNFAGIDALAVSNVPILVRLIHRVTSPGDEMRASWPSAAQRPSHSFAAWRPAESESA